VSVAALPGRAVRFALRRARKAWRDAGLGKGPSRAAARGLIADSGAFDVEWYRATQGDLGRWTGDPLGHYLDRGAEQGRDPSVLFWADWYAARHPDSRRYGGGPLAHYLMGQGNHPNPLFDDGHYLAQAGDIGPVSALAHYLSAGAAAGFDPHPLFDSRWYAARYAADIPAGTAPLMHFLKEGASGRFNPSPHFDSDVYLARYSDVAATGQNPLAHFILGGARDLRDPSPRFCTARYLRQHEDARTSPRNPLVHAMEQGRIEDAPVEPPPRLTTDPRPYLTVSAIVPNYNHARFLAERLDSILAQTAPPAEIIFLDDASSDDSLKVAERYAERSPVPFRIVHSNRRSGSAFKQWAKGLSYATGDLVWFAESDDRCAPELLATLKADFEADVHLSYAQSRPVSDTGLVLAPDYRDYTDDLSLDRWRGAYAAAGRDEVVAALAHKNTIPNGSAVLMRRATIAPLMADLETYRQCGDWFLYLACAEAGRVAFTPAVLNDHRRHGTAATRLMGGDLDPLEEAFRIRLNTLRRFALPDSTALASFAALAAEYAERTGGHPEGTPPLATLERLEAAIAELREEAFRRFGSLPPVLHIANGAADLPQPDAAGFLALARPPANEPDWACEIAPSVWIEGRAGVTAWSASALWQASDPAADRRRIATLAGLAGLLRLKSIASSGGDARRVALMVADMTGIPLAS